MSAAGEAMAKNSTGAEAAPKAAAETAPAEKIVPKNGLAAKLLAAQAKISGFHGHDKTNREQGYRYLSDEALTDVVGEAMAECGIAMLPAKILAVTDYKIPGQKGEKPAIRVEMEFRICDPDTGEIETGTGVGDAYNLGGKGIFVAQTGARKYFFRMMFNISSGNDPEDDKNNPPRDEDGEQERPRNQQRPPAQRQQQAPPQNRPPQAQQALPPASPPAAPPAAPDPIREAKTAIVLTVRTMGLDTRTPEGKAGLQGFMAKFLLEGQTEHPLNELHRISQIVHNYAILGKTWVKDAFVYPDHIAYSRSHAVQAGARIVMSEREVDEYALMRAEDPMSAERWDAVRDTFAAKEAEGYMWDPESKMFTKGEKA